MMSLRMSLMVKLALKSMIMLKYIDFGGHSLLKKSQNQLGSPFPQFRQWVFRFFFFLDMSHSQMLGKFEYTLPAKF